MIRSSGFDHFLEILKQSSLELTEKPGEEHDGFEVDCGLGTALKLVSGCSRTYVERAAGSNNWTGNYQEVG